jgi:hypothetical protein
LIFREFLPLGNTILQEKQIQQKISNKTDKVINPKAKDLSNTLK